MGQPLVWNNEQKTEIIQLFNSKQSMGVIAEKYNTTRGAIASVIHRARLRPIPGIEVRPVNHSKIKPLVHRWGKQVEAVKPQIKLVTLMGVPVVKHKRIRLRLFQDQEVCLLDLQAHHCRYPLGDPRQSDFRFCGCDRVGVGPYCASHTQLANRVPTPRSDIRQRYR